MTEYRLYGLRHEANGTFTVGIGVGKNHTYVPITLSRMEVIGLGLDALRALQIEETAKR